MKLDFVRKEVLDFLDKEVKPLYKTFDKAHNLSHYKFVTNNCVNYACALIKRGEKVNREIAYVVGALHDVGIKDGREGHAKSSRLWVRENKELEKFFDKDVIKLIAEAVEDHSSHLAYEPRSIYGKIVADADRNNTLYLVFSRPVKFGIKNEAFRTREEQIERVYEFVQDKFGENGYVRYHLNIDEVTKEQKLVWELLKNKEKCLMYIAGIFDEVTKGKYKQKSHK